jgi:hypothetical protein
MQQVSHTVRGAFIRLIGEPQAENREAGLPEAARAAFIE